MNRPGHRAVGGVIESSGARSSRCSQYNSRTQSMFVRHRPGRRRIGEAKALSRFVRTRWGTAGQCGGLGVLAGLLAKIHGCKR
jgi:hypothetical protein